MSSYGCQGSLNLARQALLIRHDWPAFTASVKGSMLVARGKLQPTRITAEYAVRVEYSFGERPSVFVEGPALHRRPEKPDEPIPHTYESTTIGDERPCVFLPREDWSPSMPISRTVIPWTMAWLVDYELWLATGEWMGGGHHPDVDIDRPTRRLRRAANRLGEKR